MSDVECELFLHIKNSLGEAWPSARGKAKELVERTHWGRRSAIVLGSKHSDGMNVSVFMSLRFDAIDEVTEGKFTLAWDIGNPADKVLGWWRLIRFDSDLATIGHSITRAIVDQGLSEFSRFESIADIQRDPRGRWGSGAEILCQSGGPREEGGSSHKAVQREGRGAGGGS